jgi:hypothetical protein
MDRLVQKRDHPSKAHSRATRSRSTCDNAQARLACLLSSRPRRGHRSRIHRSRSAATAMGTQQALIQETPETKERCRQDATAAPGSLRKPFPNRTDYRQRTILSEDNRSHGKWIAQPMKRSAAAGSSRTSCSTNRVPSGHSHRLRTPTLPRHIYIRRGVEVRFSLEELLRWWRPEYTRRMRCR